MHLAEYVATKRASFAFSRIKETPFEFFSVSDIFSCFWNAKPLQLSGIFLYFGLKLKLLIL